MKKGQVKVYIVDDHRAMREALCYMLREAGHATEAHASGEEFLEAGGAAGEGCLILDLRMPAMDGMEVYRRLRAAGSAIPVIILTGHGEVGSAVSAMKAGAFDYLMKPVDRKELLGCVRAALALAKAGRDSQQQAGEVRAMLEKLSRREREVLREVAAGHSSKQIARRLGVSARTISNHRAHFMQKMKAANVADLARKLSLLGPIGGKDPER
jgi:two-component system response regulator FixJ